MTPQSSFVKKAMRFNSSGTFDNFDKQIDIVSDRGSQPINFAHITKASAKLAKRLVPLFKQQH